VFDWNEFMGSYNAPGWTLPVELMALAFLAAHQRKDAKILEIGAWTGASTMALVAGAGKDVGRTVHTVDLWAGKDRSYRGAVNGPMVRRAFFKRMQPYIDTNRLTVCEGDYKEILPTLEKGAYDLIFVDGPHGLEDVEPTLSLVPPLLSNSGAIVFHDASGNWSAVTKMVEGLMATGDFDQPPRMVYSMAVCPRKADKPDFDARKVGE